MWYVGRRLASARRAALLAGLLLAVRATSAGAQESPGGVHVALDWTRAPGAERCISPEELLARMRARAPDRVLGFDQQGADFVVVGRIEPRAGGFRIALVLRDGRDRRLGERSFDLQARSCRALDESLILALNLMVDTPGLRRPAEHSRTSDEPGGTGADLPRAAPPEIETQPESRTLPRPEASLGPSPGPPRASPRAPPPRPPWGLEFGLGASATGGLVPRPTVGPALHGTLRPPGFIPIAFRGALYPFAVDRITLPGEGISVRGFVAGFDLCPLGLVRGPLAALACAGIHLAGLHAEPLGPRSNAGDLLFPVFPVRAEMRAHVGTLAPYAAITTRFSPTTPTFVYRARSGEDRTSFGVLWATAELELGLVWRISP